MASSLSRGLDEYRKRAKEQWQADAFYRAVSNPEEASAGNSGKTNWRISGPSLLGRMHAMMMIAARFIRAYGGALLQRSDSESAHERWRRHALLIAAACIFVLLCFAAAWMVLRGS